MFPAYSGESNKKSLFPIVSTESVEEATTVTRTDWLNNESFKLKTEEQKESLEESCKHLQQEVLKNQKEKAKKHKKKEKHKKKKKKKDTTTESSSSEDERQVRKKSKQLDLVKNELIEATAEQHLLDAEYLSFFSQISPEQLKKAFFFEDIPGLTHRNAFKLDKRGDKNNMCFDSVYQKFLPNYRQPYEPNSLRRPRLLKSGKKIGKKQLRKQQLIELKKRRYFVQKIVDCDSKKPVESTLSNKMWLHLEINKELEAEAAEKQTDRTAEFMKQLHENKHDISKWLAFISYQSLNGDNSTNYERQLSIFEKALSDNPANFRLRLELLKFKASSIETAFDDSMNTIGKIEAEFLALIFHAEQQTNVDDLCEVWFEFIKFLIGNNSSHLNCDKIKQFYVKCFQFFLRNTKPFIVNQLKRHQLIQNMIQLLESYAGFMCRCGYVERAVGIYQALLDFSFCTNSSNKLSKYNGLNVASRRTLFELYWDIGLPKFGEELSRGWIDCLEEREQLFEKLELNSGMNRHEDYLDTVEDSVLARKTIRIEYRWLELERMRSTYNWYPFYPRTILGESADDCVDPDRLVSFDEVGFLLFDVNIANEAASACFKFKLFCKFMKLLDLISWNEEVLDLNRMDASLNEEDAEFVGFLNDKFMFFHAEPPEQQDVGAGASNFFNSLIQNLYNLNKSSCLNEQEKETALANLLILNKHTIDFVRNMFEQSMQSFRSSKFRTNMTVLKWKFELNLIFVLTKSKAVTFGEAYRDYFCPKTVKANLLNQAKLDLSLEHNRSNFDLWKQYGVLKWILNHGRFADDLKTVRKAGNLKETKKIFDNLLSSSSSLKLSDSLNVYSLCIDYVLLELGMFHKQFDVTSTSLNVFEANAELATIHMTSGLFDLSQTDLRIKESREALTALKTRLSDLLVKNCLNKDAEHQKSQTKSTFKIGILNNILYLLF